MKRFPLTLSVIVSVVIAAVFPNAAVFTADPPDEAPVQTEAEKICQEYLPDETYKKILDGFAEEKRVADFEGVMLAFDESRTAYHTYNECLFEYAEQTVLGSVWLQQARTTVGTITVNAPNTPNVPDWMKPDVACLDSKEVSQVIARSSASVLVPPLLMAHQAYAGQLKTLRNKLSDLGGANVTKIGRQAQDVKQMFSMELQDSWEAVNTALLAFKEMRVAFVMHVHFQCMLNHLERYRRFLEDIRKITEILPNILHDASKH